MRHTVDDIDEPLVLGISHYSLCNNQLTVQSDIIHWKWNGFRTIQVHL